MQVEKDNLMVRLIFQFSLNVLSFTEKLEKHQKFNLANQLFKSETSIRSNVREAQWCESKDVGSILKVLEKIIHSSKSAPLHICTSAYPL